MRTTKTSLAIDFQLASHFDALRRKLLADDAGERCERPLAYWAVATDRGLPLALIGRPVGELLSMPFEQLHATRGVGHKKLQMLIRLLDRAAGCDPSDVTPARDTADGAAADSRPMDGQGARRELIPDWQAVPSREACLVSEALWSQWRGTVMSHGLGDEAIGRFVPSLRRLPRVVWHKPLADYAQFSLAEIRAMKTHGEKRVSAVVETFAGLHSMLATIGSTPYLAARPAPLFVRQLETWLARQYPQPGASDRQPGARGRRPGVPSDHEIRTCLIEVLLAQVRVDAGDQVAELVERRLGNEIVRNIAPRMGLTRARVYQLLAEAGAALAVRWPQGRGCVLALQEALRARTSDRRRLLLLDSAIELFFPAQHPLMNRQRAPARRKMTLRVPRRHAG